MAASPAIVSTSAPGAQQPFQPAFLLPSPSYIRCSSSALKKRHGSQLSLNTNTVFPLRSLRSRNRRVFHAVSTGSQNAGEDPLLVMISGAPASGKGTQCEFIVDKYGLLHISTGDLLRAEVAAGTENGKKANAYMSNGQLVPDEIVIQMVKDKLTQAAEDGKGWLLDGFPRTSLQADALEKLGIKPDVFIVLEVPDEVLIERVVGRRLDPVTGKIYHLKYSPPESDEIAARLIQRSDDTEEKARTRLQSYYKNVGPITSIYKNVVTKIDGNRPKDAVFVDVDKSLSGLKAKKAQETAAASISQEDESGMPTSVTYENKANWRGIPTRLNSIPHSREIRQYFYVDVVKATKRAVEDGIHKLKVQITIPELNPEMDVYRIGTLLELMRELAFSFASDGKRVKVCVQGSMGEGVFSGMPLQLAGTRQLLELMDWGDYESKGTFINIGAIGKNHVLDTDDIFILMAPQNAVANCIIDDLKGMVDAAGDRPVIIVNPRLKDLPSAAGVMQIRGREKRMEFAGSFFDCYSFRLLYTSGTQYPILGALRKAYPSQYELYKRVDFESGKEKYLLLGTFNEEPNGQKIEAVFDGRDPTKETGPTGFWKLVFGL